MKGLRRKITVICGPTSTGKTTLALRLCQEHGGKIISADSRQIYKYMDVGTGKLPVGTNIKIERGEKKWMAGGINIWGYDLVKPDEYFSGYDYTKFALDLIPKIPGNVFVVGGTGFYLDMLTGRIKPSLAEPDFTLRAELEKKSLEELVEEFRLLSQDKSITVDTKNRVRVIRALEKLKTGHTQNLPLNYLTNIEFIFWGLTAPRDFLYGRADKWTDEIWANGLVKEYQKLVELGYQNSPKLSGLIYKSVKDLVEGRQAKFEAIQRTKFALHAYIRRQQTWFRRNKNIKWFDISSSNFLEDIKQASLYNLNHE